MKGTPTRLAYSLQPWAAALGKDRALLSTLLRHAWAEGKGLHPTSNMKRAVEEAGLDWSEACERMGSAEWKDWIERNQDEMVEGMGLWGVPSYKLSGPSSEPDLVVWGQDRLWLALTLDELRSKFAAVSDHDILIELLEETGCLLFLDSSKTHQTKLSSTRF